MAIEKRGKVMSMPLLLQSRPQKRRSIPSHIDDPWEGEEAVEVHGSLLLLLPTEPEQGKREVEVVRILEELEKLMKSSDGDDDDRAEIESREREGTGERSNTKEIA
ncbi:hypothetical protein CRG98_019499 [Punica granatum]|uniref:Uncharacterized protein n=1 Tax=Punica granatum TaxID=22663 RepID=A0A2I0JUZ1_PUNGR|nr:hypothetical protein CRG98_019499 [Punica granatum]